MNSKILTPTSQTPTSTTWHWYCRGGFFLLLIGLLSNIGESDTFGFWAVVALIVASWVVTELCACHEKKGIVDFLEATREMRIVLFPLIIVLGISVLRTFGLDELDGLSRASANAAFSLSLFSVGAVTIGYSDSRKKMQALRDGGADDN